MALTPLTSPALVGIEEVTNKQFLFFPNPVQAKGERLKLKGGPNNTPLSFQLFDALGRKMEYVGFWPGDGLSLQRQSPGVYFYILESQGKESRGKLVVK